MPPEEASEVPLTLEKEQKFNQAVEKGIQEAFELHDIRYGPDSDNPQDYHHRGHPEKVVSRTDKLSSAIREIDPDQKILTDHQIRRTRLIGGWHDTVQNWKPKVLEDKGTIKEFRQRDRGPNELASIKELQDYMRKINQESNEAIFSDDDIAIVEEAVKGTIPGFDPEKGVVIQPNNHPGDPIEKIIVSLADLGGAGIGGSNEFGEEGSGEFKEINVGITRVVKQALASGGIENISTEDREYISNSIKEWLKSQINFVKGRAGLLDQELANIADPAVREKIKNSVFTEFPASIVATEARAKDVDSKTFEELLNLIGYAKLLSPVKSNLL